MKKNKSLLKKIKTAINNFKEIAKNNDGSYKPSYRVANIEQDEKGEYFVTIQMIGKATVYKTKPEQLLADDKLVDLFSPRDIRNLTYLGYLGINAPKYKILAKQFLEDTGQAVFAVAKTGEENYQTVTAHEISSNDEIIAGLSQKDAHMVGYTSASEKLSLEKQQKEELLKQLKNDSTDNQSDK